MKGFIQYGLTASSYFDSVDHGLTTDIWAELMAVIYVFIVSCDSCQWFMVGVSSTVMGRMK